MIYLDYSATTPTDKEVLDTFIKASAYIGNPNSLHKLGLEAKKLIDASTKQISQILKVNSTEIIYTSGSSESNNLAIKGIEIYKHRGKHIITTELEHSSIYGPLNYLSEKGYEIDFVKLDKNGLVDLKHLESLIRNDTILVTIASVNSETGIKQPIEKIGELLKKYPKCIFHVDMTQSIGKVKIDITNIDMFSFSAHKIFGIKGIGCLIKKDNIKLTPLIHGGKSTTIYRAGTPPVALIASLAKTLRLIVQNIDYNYEHVKTLNKKIIEALKDSDIAINSNQYSIPYILNISLLNIKPETFQHALEEEQIYISTQSACSSGGPSKAVYALTKDKIKAETSIRISLSKNTTIEEIDTFIKVFKNKLERYKSI